MEQHYNKLTPQQAELLSKLSEECAEVIHIVAKIQLHGLLSCHPETGRCNHELLHQELGDVQCVQNLLKKIGMVNVEQVAFNAEVKHGKLIPTLHHYSETP